MRNDVDASGHRDFSLIRNMNLPITISRSTLSSSLEVISMSRWWIVVAAVAGVAGAAAAVIEWRKRMDADEPSPYASWDYGVEVGRRPGA